ncbi:MAG: Flp pilus assembly complex ATPase component TadA [Clostridium tyrobutyricum]|jgi:ABC-type cobalamin/Fe3+-siderophores transport system ATPase subunit|uniref:ATPase, T2SS/T4P/T4SS family n=1 Tax=Clostridium tyrobutyricum TaxID=1519 RepID=UPI0011CBFAE6|nr:ATPase, T2SS/T4P/T4SS family [Clostridium tyrobutyricum]MCH4200654.1 Flp pilus assembly complex ATPase component TadA [Clostridium tyrobutyricum]MCH4237552.1 Flp pilus assembly complex ATPase component TadA [Clostridium tyrobutyricum]MCH4260137.1 Flp pilus assembly complex ATPase component TadA [Clostridium tyrobutyricum]MCI2011753.1 Flp pilus assembly complex ATPase component TadA [Clostridium tyrobutyricum]
MQRLLNPKIYNINVLINSGTLSKEDAKYLTQSVDEHKNIIITGPMGSGKTTILNSLVSYKKTEYIGPIKSENISINDILLISPQNRGVVIEEICIPHDVLSMLLILKIGSNVLTTYPTNKNIREEFLHLFSYSDAKIRDYVAETMNKNEFIQVKMSMNTDGKRSVYEIQEV